jgi:hypothetical protein
MMFVMAPTFRKQEIGYQEITPQEDGQQNNEGTHGTLESIHGF